MNCIHLILDIKKLVFFLYKIKILLYPNISVYMCETPSWRLESWSLPTHPISTYTYEVTNTLRVWGAKSRDSSLIYSAYIAPLIYLLISFLWSATTYIWPNNYASSARMSSCTTNNIQNSPLTKLDEE